ncbi:MAG: hypothetical protein JRN24_02185, partial [Nitrososphaerota archaeon]|nr:hypothetical protein [Nitrososphaerota archaeon]
MLPFRAHYLELRGRHCLLLPKLNLGQMKIIRERLAEGGFTVTRGPSIVATRPDLVVHVEPLGLCWATS